MTKVRKKLKNEHAGQDKEIITGNEIKLKPLTNLWRENVGLSFISQ
jgi:hypothetical protein